MQHSGSQCDLDGVDKAENGGASKMSFQKIGQMPLHEPQKQNIQESLANLGFKGLPSDGHEQLTSQALDQLASRIQN